VSLVGVATTPGCELPSYAVMPHPQMSSLPAQLERLEHRSTVVSELFEQGGAGVNPSSARSTGAMVVR
jgi:hypothetical protein